MKIISCIPIDVTELQQKITHLEKELQETQKSKARNETKKTTVLQEGNFLCSPNCKHVNNVAISCNRLSPTDYSTGEDTHRLNNCCLSKLNPEPSPKSQDYVITESELTDQVEQQPANLKPRTGFFSKQRKLRKKRIMNTQMVYYAQNQATSPFEYCINGDCSSRIRRKKDSTSVNKPDLNGAYRKLYNHSPAQLSENANESEFSTPICRDVLPIKKEAEIQLPESDICSCCHGPFQNVDNHIHRHNHFNLAAPRRENRNAYYDSNLYDVVPVKENAPKVKHDVIKRHEPNNSVNIACWPEKTRPKYKIPRVISTHHCQAPTRHQIKIIRKAPAKSQYRKDLSTNKVLRIKPSYNPSKSRSIEFSEIYTKRLMKTRRKIANVAYKEATKRQDRACLTTVITNTECQTASLPHVHPKEQKREEDVKGTTSKRLQNETDVTLNQIKNILQTVLAEVKTNSKISNVPDHEKKDAIVQNGPSQSNIFGGSSFLHSFTYSPYNINSYNAPCTRQIPTSCYPPYVPTSPIKCMQYPLLLQPGKNMCTNCYKNNPLSFNHHLSNPLNIGSNVKNATSAATNTEQSQSRSKETENLIKEIYKSIALNQDSSKDERVSERSDVTDNFKRFKSSSSEEREAKADIAKAISEIFKNTKPIETSETRSISPPDSKLTSVHPSSLKNHEIIANISEYHSDIEKSDSVDSDEAEPTTGGLQSDEYDDESDCTIMNKDESDSDVTESENRELKTKPEVSAILVSIQMLQKLK